MQEVRQKGHGDCVLNVWRVLYNGIKTARAGVAVVLAPDVKFIHSSIRYVRMLMDEWMNG